MRVELYTAYDMVAKRDATIAQLKQAAQDALSVNESAVAESCALMELLRRGDWTTLANPDAPMDDDTSELDVAHPRTPHARTQTHQHLSCYYFPPNASLPTVGAMRS